MRRPRKFETMLVDDEEMISWGASTSVREMFVHRQGGWKFGQLGEHQRGKIPRVDVKEPWTICQVSICSQYPVSCSSHLASNQRHILSAVAQIFEV